VKILKEINDTEESGIIVGCKDVQTLYTYFISKFTKENFLDVFYWMDGYLDVDGSSALGKYYMQSKCLDLIKD